MSDPKTPNSNKPYRSELSASELRNHVFGDRSLPSARPVLLNTDAIEEDTALTVLEILVKTLREFEQLDSMKSYAGKYVSNNQEGAEDYPTEAVVLLTKIDEIANAVLITDEGSPDFGSVAFLERQGFSVVAGETDSFGWLSGVIQTRCGKIVFG